MQQMPMGQMHQMRMGQMQQMPMGQMQQVPMGQSYFGQPLFNQPMVIKHSDPDNNYLNIRLTQMVNPAARVTVLLFRRP